MNIKNAVIESWEIIDEHKYFVATIIALIVSLAMAWRYEAGLASRSPAKTVSISVWMPENPTVLVVAPVVTSDAIEEARKLSANVSHEQMESLSKGAENTVILNRNDGLIYYLCHKKGMYYLSVGDVGSSVVTQADESNQGAYLLKQVTLDGNTIKAELYTPRYWLVFIFGWSLLGWFLYIYCIALGIFLVLFLINYVVEKVTKFVARRFAFTW